MAHDREPTKTLDEPTTDVTGTNEVQKVTVENAKEGTFTLTFAGETTEAIAHDASNNTVEDALAALHDLDAEQFSLSGSLSAGLEITFEGSWGSQDVPTITADATNLVDEGEAEGEEAAISIETVTAGVGEGVIRGTGLADRTNDTSPLTGESPAEIREEEGSEFGDA